ncbi:phage tail sheath protein [Oxobacter pfennigii]|uniref:Phage tail sheath protein n=1 Tax=Oxobacter pfennigii TaxID=36849 RepID=A0A0P8WT55_9CLOT|nr:phage tail sheath family protein [Oxobacter pfennigii]KPU45813.1 phage tail sheath protein [Oxobacter pfennigii]
MSGGIWTTQNKVRPGVYVNFNSEPQVMGSIGERGIVTMPLMLSWGEPKKVISVGAGEDVSVKLGYAISDSKLLLVKEALKRAQTLLLYRLNTGTKATATAGNLTVTAKWGGVRGNDITVAITENIDDPSYFDVVTLMSGVLVDTQTAADISGLAANDWVEFGGTGELTESAGMPLTGGADGTVTNQDYIDYLAAAEITDFNTMALPVTDSTLKGLAVSFCKRLRDDEGKKIQVVIENYPEADYEGVISVKNGVVLSDGTALTAANCTAWVAGATAGAKMNESLTYTTYDGAADVSPRYTNTQIAAALQAGEFVFTASDNKAVVEQDINSLTGYTPTKGKAFSKNRVIRVLDGINNDFVRIFSDFYIGKVANNDDGRNLLKNECVNYMNSLQGIGAVQNFDSQADIAVLPGAGADSVYIEVHAQPVDSVEKIYIGVEVA